MKLATAGCRVNLNVASHRPAVTSFSLVKPRTAAGAPSRLFARHASTTLPSPQTNRQLPRLPADRAREVKCRASSLAAELPDRQELSGVEAFFGVLRAVVFFGISLTLAVPLFCAMLAVAPFVYLLDKHRRIAQHFCNFVWAKLSMLICWMNVEVEGRENLPAKTTAAVYVANHQSFLDIYSLFHLDRPFKFISKTSIFFIPLIGWSMFLTGHVMLNREDRKSQLKCLTQCIDLLKSGASVLFFPEGTRAKDCKLRDFKKGAFSVAVKAGTPVVPMSIIGTGNVMQSGREWMVFPGKLKIVIHKPIETKGQDADEVCSKARAAIASSLPPELLT